MRRSVRPVISPQLPLGTPWWATRDERLPHGPTELPEPDWFLHDRRQPVEPGGGPRGDPMKHAVLMEAGLALALGLLLAGCGAKGQANPAAEAPPAAEVEREQDANMVKVDHPEQFPLATASAHVARSEE